MLMYGNELTATIIKLVASGKASTVSEIKNAIIEANPGYFNYDYQRNALYHRILRHLHSMNKAGLIKMKPVKTDLNTKKYKVCLDLT